MKRWFILGACVVTGACSQASQTTDAGADASADASADATTNDASTNDASSDAGTLDVHSLGSCQLGTGDCWDYFGNGWTAGTAAAGCNADSGSTLTWDASCPTTNRTGSCVEATGAYGFVERCYPPVTTQQCQGICSNFDGGFYPN